MPRITTLRANVTRDDAVRYFTQGVANKVANLTRGPVRSLAELYIPYRLYEVRVSSGGRVESQIFALDAVRGELDLYQFQAQDEGNLISLESRNVLPSGVAGSQAEAQMIAKVRRVVFTRGFFRVRDLRIEAHQLAGEICVPYWVCFRGPDARVSLSVLDAVRRRPEGAKVRRLVEEWLRSEPGLEDASEASKSQVLS